MTRAEIMNRLFSEKSAKEIVRHDPEFTVLLESYFKFADRPKLAAHFGAYTAAIAARLAAGERFVKPAKKVRQAKPTMSMYEFERMVDEERKLYGMSEQDAMVSVDEHYC